MTDDLREAMARAMLASIEPRSLGNDDAWIGDAFNGPGWVKVDGDISLVAMIDAILALFEARGLALVHVEAPESLRPFARAYREYIAAAKVTP